MPVDIDEGKRLLTNLLTADAKQRRGQIWLAGHIRSDWCKWSEGNGAAMLAELRELREQVDQLTQARDAGKGGERA